MKRCPQCNRVETDEALRFCRVDGATLVSDSSSIDEAGTIKLGSGHVTGEAATGKLPPMTDANINRATAATSVLPPQPVGSTFADFRITAKTRVTWRGLTLIGAAIVIMVAAVIIISYRTRSNSAPIQSIAVMPFVNASGNTRSRWSLTATRTTQNYCVTALPLEVGTHSGASRSGSGRASDLAL